MHSAGLELTKLTYTRLEDNLIRHRDDHHYWILIPWHPCPGFLLPIFFLESYDVFAGVLHINRFHEQHLVVRHALQL